LIIIYESTGDDGNRTHTWDIIRNNETDYFGVIKNFTGEINKLGYTEGVTHWVACDVTLQKKLPIYYC